MEDATDEETSLAKCIVDNFQVINKYWEAVEQENELLSALLCVSLMANIFFLFHVKFRAST